MKSSPVLGVGLMAAGFLLAALDAPLVALGLGFSITREWSDPTFQPLELYPKDVLEFLGLALVATGGILVYLRFRRQTDRISQGILAGIFLVTAGALLRILFYALTYAAAPSLVDEGGTLAAWVAAWDSASLALAAGAATLATMLSPARARLPVGAGMAAAAILYGFLALRQLNDTLALLALRDLALAALAAGLLEAALTLRKNPLVVFQ